MQADPTHRWSLFVCLLVLLAGGCSAVDPVRRSPETFERAPAASAPASVRPRIVMASWPGEMAVQTVASSAQGAAPLRQLVAAMEAEARAAGARRLSITGHAVVNRGFLNPATAQRFGFRLRIIDESTIELVKELAQ